MIQANTFKGTRIKTMEVVYYRSLVYTFIAEEPKMEFFDLVSNIEGVFGLFIGMNFLSLIEFIELFSNLTFVFKKSEKI